VHLTHHAVDRFHSRHVPHLAFHEARTLLASLVPGAAKLRAKTWNGQDQWLIEKPRVVLVTKTDPGNRLVVVTVLPEPVEQPSEEDLDEFRAAAERLAPSYRETPPPSSPPPLSPWTLITYFFSHSMIQFLHILFNMLVLYWFGRIFTEYLGSDKLIAVYVLGGIAGGLVYLMAYNLIPNPPEFLSRGTGLVGASAAIFAVMVAIATMLPDYTVFLMFLGPVKIKYIAGVYIFLSFVGSVGSNAGGEIAHLGGALIGFVYTKQLQAGVNWGAWVTYLLEGIKSLFRPRPKVKVSYRKSDGGQRPTAGSGISQKEIDDILDKISDGGYESLSKDEKEKLFKASKK
jgi:membrane associated rhomboid family serine protease